MEGKKRKPNDTRLTAARYQLDGSLTGDDAAEDETDTAGQTTMEQRAQFVEISIQQAMRRGDFDHLPGAGKPLRNLHDAYDPNWWIRQKIERENITGLGPPALTLRSESARLDDKLDAAPGEKRVRELLDDFNSRVIEARRQLKGGPPVVTATRDVETEVARWRERRDARHREHHEQQAAQDAAYRALSWRERRRMRRAGPAR